MEWNNKLKPKPNMIEKATKLMENQVGVVNQGNQAIDAMTKAATNMIGNMGQKPKKKGFGFFGKK
jgi:hypothetical protein